MFGKDQLSWFLNPAKPVLETYYINWCGIWWRCFIWCYKHLHQITCFFGARLIKLWPFLLEISGCPKPKPSRPVWLSSTFWEYPFWKGSLLICEDVKKSRFFKVIWLGSDIFFRGLQAESCKTIQTEFEKEASPVMTGWYSISASYTSGPFRHLSSLVSMFCRSDVTTRCWLMLLKRFVGCLRI